MCSLSPHTCLFISRTCKCVTVPREVGVALPDSIMLNKFFNLLILTEISLSSFRSPLFTFVITYIHPLSLSFHPLSSLSHNDRSTQMLTLIRGRSLRKTGWLVATQKILSRVCVWKKMKLIVKVGVCSWRLGWIYASWFED